RRLKKTEKFTAMYALSFTAVYSYAPSIQKSHKAKNTTQIKAYTANPRGSQEPPHVQNYPI
ncbi:MAG: hypothetical protein IJF71_00725, partial [Clostridia bacterium]|nr:hypothetical protein [Clostridia bacterium]